MRGKLRVCAKPLKTNGITPAGAGKTERTASQSVGEEDHPRRCGENLRGLLIKLCLVGSPPQVRGKQKGDFFPSGFKRITPAGAGKTKKNQAW